MTRLPVVDDGARKATADALISETFLSIQGEGALAGVPSWFCRFSGCNLRCRWCDTPYASWAPAGTRRSIGELADEAEASGAGHAVLTGGEPMIFPQAAALSSELARRGLHVTIETAGTIGPDGFHTDLMSLSPKLANSAPTGDPRDPSGTWAERHERQRLDIPTLQQLIDRAHERDEAGGRHEPALQFKFVVTAPDDLAEIDGLLARLRGWRPAEIFLMPEGTATPDPASVAWVVRTCLDRGWRYGHRLHIELFGDTRGT